MLIQEKHLAPFHLLSKTVSRNKIRRLTGLNLLQAQALDWGWPLRPEQPRSLRRYAEMLVSYDQANVIGSKELPESSSITC